MRSIYVANKTFLSEDTEMIAQVILQIKVISWQYCSCWQSMMSISALIYRQQRRMPYIPAKPFKMRLSRSLGIISQGLQGRGFYSIIADEVTDKYANKEVLVLCLRFLDSREHPAIIREEFIDFANIERTTGEAVADKLTEILRLLAIPIKNM